MPLFVKSVIYRRACSAFLSLLLVVLLTGCGSEEAEITVPISRDALQKQVAANFPLTKNKIVFSNPEVMLQNDADRIGLRVSVAAPLFAGLKATGKVSGDGQLRYDAASATFFLDDIGLQEVQIDGLGDSVSRDVRKAVGPILKTLLSDVPVYTLPDTLKGRIARKTLRSVRVRNGQVEATFGLNP